VRSCTDGSAGAVANTRTGSAANVHAHYDVGNDFFQLFLDETLAYSCGLFLRDGIDLRAAQEAKFQHVCEQLRLTAGDRVLEIGCGWGGFAIYAARLSGCRVTGITISREQVWLASERVAAAGLARQVDIQYCDYREIADQFYKIVSIEMFEAVGQDYWDDFFRACARALRPGGAMLLQTIGIPDAAVRRPRRASGWISKYIFPGGMLPSLQEIRQSLARTAEPLAIVHVEEIGAHYVTTLRAWRSRFWAAIDQVRALGLDDTFRSDVGLLPGIMCGRLCGANHPRYADHPRRSPAGGGGQRSSDGFDPRGLIVPLGGQFAHRPTAARSPRPGRPS